MAEENSKHPFKDNLHRGDGENRGNCLHAPATARNRDVIMAVLGQVLPAQGTVLEIASGTGEHSIYFAPRLPNLTWIPSDADPDMRDSIAAWAKATNIPNLGQPLDIDAASHSWPIDRADAVVNINMIHISPWQSCLGLLDGAQRILPPGGILFMYGPYRRGGVHTSESNQRFDETLQSRNPQWGVRCADEVTDEAQKRGLARSDLFEMPSNNLSLVFERRA